MDTEVVDAEHAEGYLRLLAEAELRRAVARPDDDVAVADGRARVTRCADVLVAVRALAAEVADQLVDTFDLALGIRPDAASGQRNRGPRALQRRSPAEVRRHERLLNSPAAAPDLAAVAAGQLQRCRVVPVGQLVQFSGDDGAGQIWILSYAHTMAGARFTMAVTAAGSAGAFPFLQFTATDDRGTSYGLGSHCPGGGPRDWVLRLNPEPPPDLGWLDLTTTPGRAAVRIGLAQVPAAGPATADPPALSPGELLLDKLAVRLLATAPAIPPYGIGLDVAGLRLSTVAEGLGDVIAALQACGALSPASTMPGQLATLCARLSVGGHGISAPPEHHLPEPWRSVLGQLAHWRGNDAPACDSYAAAVFTLPEFDGTRLAVLGLQNSADGTILHVTWHPVSRPLEPGSAPAIWIRDDDGNWHATGPGGGGCGIYGDITMGLRVIPPLPRATSWIEILAAGPSTRAHATLPLQWLP